MIDRCDWIVQNWVHLRPKVPIINYSSFSSNTLVPAYDELFPRENRKGLDAGLERERRLTGGKKQRI